MNAVKLHAIPYSELGFFLLERSRNCPPPCQTAMLYTAVLGDHFTLWEDTTICPDDPVVNKWRAWYNSFSSCGGNLTGPNHDPLAPVDCQAFASHCPGSKHDPPVKIRTPAI